MTLANSFKSSFNKKFAPSKEMTFMEFLDLCKSNPLTYANVAERMLAAIGKPVIVDTSKDERLARIFSGNKKRMYPTFAEFYGYETAIEQIVAYFSAAAQGLEEAKQILYLKGPVGGGKSSMVEALKNFMSKTPIYVLKDNAEKNVDLKISPNFESPLGIMATMFNEDAGDGKTFGDLFTEEYGIPARYFSQMIPSPWAQHKLMNEFEGDLTRFSVIELYPNQLTKVGIAKVEPADENNQDVSVLVGKTDIRQIERFSQEHPYSYSYSGGLNRTTQGMMEFAEMFKANIKTLNPLLMATQDRHYSGTEGLPSMPFYGIIVAHSNESEWQKFANDKTNEAFLDRVKIIDIPYCLRVDEEVKIYEKMLKRSGLANAPIAPKTLQTMAEFSVLSRLKKPDNSSIYAKMKVYNGESVKATMPGAKPIHEYQDIAGPDEGLTGMSTRFAFKIISSALNLRPDEIQANPIDLMYVLEEELVKLRLKEDDKLALTAFIKEWLKPNYLEFVDKELRIAYLESYSDYGQAMFDRYFLFAEAWLDENEVRDPQTHEIQSRDKLNQKLEDIEKAAGIVNAKDFRNDVVKYVLRYKGNNGGMTPKWNEYEKIKLVIEKKMFSATQDIMPIVSFGPKNTSEEQKKHEDFLDRMRAKGYSDTQLRLMIEWWVANRKAS